MEGCVPFGVLDVDFVGKQVKDSMQKFLFVFRNGKMEQIVASVLVLLSNWKELLDTDHLQHFIALKATQFAEKSKLVDLSLQLLPWGLP